jgi:hypothetical protein
VKRSIPLSLFAGFLCWIIYDANTGASNLFFRFAASLPWGDKLGHFVLFGILTLFTNFALGFRLFQLRRIKLPVGSLIVLVFACAEELSQWSNVNRNFDFIDLTCGILGILVASLATRRCLNAKMV